MTTTSRHWSRREFVNGLGLTGTASLVGLRAGPAAAEPPPETTTIRLLKAADTICVAPQYVAEELLRGEGFTDVRYVGPAPGVGFDKFLASGDVNIAMDLAASQLTAIDVGVPMVIVAGRARRLLRALRDRPGPHDPRSEGKDRGRAGPADRSAPDSVHHDRVRGARSPEGHQVGGAFRRGVDARSWRRARLMPSWASRRSRRSSGPGRSGTGCSTRPSTGRGLNTSAAWRGAPRVRPQKHPVATKRAMRAILKAADICAREPARAGPVARRQGVRDALRLRPPNHEGDPLRRWRDYDPEDTVRFYALRLHELGMIKTSPQKLIAQGTDWRFLTELKRELKG